MSKRLLPIVAGLALAAASGTAPAVTVQVINLDTGTGAGLDDPTPRTPQGGNPGTTLGEQRRIAYQFAADIWGAVLAGDVPVRVTARFIPQECTATGAVLGSAGAARVFRDFAGSVPNTWYASAVAKSITGTDLTAGLTPDDADVRSQFNSRIGTDPNCLGGRSWYYGLDGNTPPGDINFLNVVMHEIGHGLGFQGFESLINGSLFLGSPSIYGRFAFDNVAGASIANLPSNGARFQAMRRDGALVWTGPSVTAQAPQRLGPRTEIAVNAPAALAGQFFGFVAGAIGPAATPANFSGDVALVDDGSGPTASLGCGPLVNAAAVAGRIALVDRGTCNFSVKVLNAQAAGAIGVLVANNAPGFISPGGDGTGITIPVVGIEQATGATFKANLAGLNIALQTNPNRLAGADNAGRALLFAPALAQQGSSYSHFDVRHDPNALMEPSITTTLRANLNLDLTPALFEDQGYGIDRGGARIGGCDTTIPVFANGGAVTGASVIATANLCAAGARNKGQYQSCVVAYGNQLRDRGLISGEQKGRLASCAANSGP